MTLISATKLFIETSKKLGEREDDIYAEIDLVCLRVY